MDLVVVFVVLLLLPVVIARPFAGAVLYTALAYFRPQNLVGGLALEMRLSMIVLAATLLGVAIAWVRGKERPELRTPWFVFVIALTGCYWLAAQAAVFPDLAAAAWLAFAKTMVGVGVTVALCTTPARIRIIAVTAALGLGVMASISLLNPVWEAGRLTGGGGDFRDSNDFALALCMVLPLLLCCWRIPDRKSTRVTMIALVPVVLVAIVLTQSRGGFLALAAVLTAWALFTRGRVFKIALAPAAILAFLALAPPVVLERLTTIQNYSHDSSARDRLSSWKVARRIAEDRPLTGVGPGNFLAVYDRYKNDFRMPHVAHNTPLQIVANAGIPALGVFALFLLYGIAAPARLAGKARVKRRLATTKAARDSLEWVDSLGTGISLAVLGYAIGSQFLSREDMDLFYLLAGLTAAMAAQTRDALSRRTETDPRTLRGRVVEVPCVSVH